MKKTPTTTRLKGVSTSMVYVYRLPDKLSDGYCFGGGKPIGFTNVDWFGVADFPDKPAKLREAVTEFIKNKRYYDPKAKFLVLSDHPSYTFVIQPRELANANVDRAD